MSSNSRHLLRLWAFPAALLSGLAFLAVTAALRGHWWVPLLAILPALLVAGVWWRMRERVRRLFLHESPDAMVALIRSADRPGIPYSTLAASANLAKHYALWGDFESARRQLEPHDWSSAPDIYRSMALQARALVSFLSRTDIGAGLADARRALALSEVPNVPGRASARTAAQTYVDLGEILNGEAKDGIAEELRARLSRSSYPMLTLLLYWGLGVIHERSGDSVQAAASRRALSERAPHCRPLHDFAS